VAGGPGTRHKISRGGESFFYFALCLSASRHAGTAVQEEALLGMATQRM
jgi:hypothetical protein